MNEGIKAFEENIFEIPNSKENNEITNESTKIDRSDSFSDTYTIVIDGQEQNYLIQTYKEMKTTNFLLYLLLVTIVLMFVLSKFYYFAKSLFRVRF